MSGLLKVTLLGLLVVGIGMNLMFGDSGGNYHGFNMNEHGFYVVDFLVFVLVIGYFVKKPAKKFLEDRHEAVRTEMDEAGKVLTDAQERLSTYEGQLQGLTDEASRMNADFQADGDREKARLESETKSAVAKIKRDLETRMGQESARIRGELQVRVSTEALEIAETKIRAAMDKSTQRRLVKQYISDLQKIEQLGELRQDSA